MECKSGRRILETTVPTHNLPHFEALSWQYSDIVINGWDVKGEGWWGVVERGEVDVFFPS
jgi:hypothetical protein